MKDIIYAKSINGGDELLRFEYSAETGLYHWHGDTNYAGYTADELLSRED